MTMDFQAGTAIGSYVLESYVGGGSFGAVWRAHRSDSGQLVAIKLLTGALATDTSTRADVEVLAAAAASKSKHVVKVLDGGQEPVPFIVMEFVEGQDLQSLLREKTRLGVTETIEVGLAISDALSALDQVGIVHRDIKPANVMLDNDGVIKLADFGIAKIVGYETRTMAGQAAMTMAYAAPEIWNDDGAFGRPSHRSDLYAMAVLLFQCLAGFTPFTGNYGALYRAHTEQAPDLGSLPAETPPSLRALIRRCLEKRQDDRPHDAVECISMLDRAEAEFATAAGNSTIREPVKLGPWVKLSPHESLPWAWRCRHETSGVEATVELHFADKLDYGFGMRKAIAANSKLTPLGAERLLESNRLLLHPTEAWWHPPAGEFQFWVAREDAAAVQTPSVNRTELRNAVTALIALIDAGEAEGMRLDLGNGNLVVLEGGGVYLRRPGITQPAGDIQAAALDVLSAQPLEGNLRQAIFDSHSLSGLQALLAEGDGESTVLMGATQLQKPVDDAPTTLARPPQQVQVPVTQPPVQVIQPVAVAPAPAPVAASRTPPPVAPPPRVAASGGGSPMKLIGAGAGVVLVVAVAAFFLLSGGDKKVTTDPVDASAAHLIDKGAAPPEAAKSPVPYRSTPGTSALSQKEYVDSTILVENNDTDCADGKAGCRLIFAVGPYRFRGNLLRIEFTLQVITPSASQGVFWKNDMQADADARAAGDDGVQLEGESGSIYHLKAAGGVASEDHKSLAAGRYTGYWEFTFNEDPGSTLTFNYPDFENYITIPVPE